MRRSLQLNREIKQYRSKEAFQLVKYLVDGDINKEDFDRLLEILIKINPIHEIATVGVMCFGFQIIC